jgi:hypothetical protein
MGRKKIYLTDEQKAEAHKKYCKSYYERNKDILNSKSMKKYYEKKTISEHLQNNESD